MTFSASSLLKSNKSVSYSTSYIYLQMYAGLQIFNILFCCSLTGKCPCGFDMAQVLAKDRTNQSLKSCLPPNAEMLLPTCDCHLFFTVTEIPDKNNLEEETFILSHGFKEFSPWSAGSKVETSRRKEMTKGSCSSNGSQEAHGESNGEKGPGHSPRDLLPLPRSYLPIHSSY